MRFNRKKSAAPPEAPPLPQAVRDFAQAVRPVGAMLPLASMQQQQPQPPQPESGQSPSLPMGGGLHSIDRIVELRIRQWLEEMKKAREAEGKPSSSGRSLNFFPPRR